MRDPYLVLGVKPSASGDEIKAAWRRLAKELHPDRNPGDPQANQRFSEIGQAYQLLKDPAKRQRYDLERRMREEAKARGGTGQAGRARTAEPPRPGNGAGAAAGQNQGQNDGQQGRSDASASEIFANVWRKMAGKAGGEDGNAGNPGKAPDLVVDVPVTIEDIMGRARVMVPLPDGRQLRITLPEGVTDGRQVRVPAQGHRIHGMKRGDVLVTFRLARHPVFRPDGLDLYTSVPVDIENAVLGCETVIDAPDGPIRIKVPEWSGSDRVVRIKGRGLPGKEGERGDLLAEIRVMLWDHPDDKVKDLMRSLREGLFL